MRLSLLLPCAVVLCGLLAGAASSDKSKPKAAKDKADRESEFQANEKELAKLEAQIAAKEKELAELKRKAAPLRAKVAEAKLTRTVETAIQEARRQYPRDPDSALQMLRWAVVEVWDKPEISERGRQALLSRLVTAREELIKGRK
jgi:hypothetical protein